jgi:hypothetical protein
MFAFIDKMVNDVSDFFANQIRYVQKHNNVWDGVWSLLRGGNIVQKHDDEQDEMVVIPVDQPYTEVSLIVDGALAEEETFYDGDELEMEKFVEGIIALGKIVKNHVEIFTIRHEHPELVDDEACSCVQYLQDHRPMWANGEPSTEQLVSGNASDAK